MAKEASSSTDHPKLPRVSKGQKIKKGLLLHPPVAGRRTGSTTQKVVYVSPSSPFISIVKRVKTYLREIENRSSPAITLTRSGDHEVLKTIEASVINAAKGNKEGVTVTGTGRAIDKVLQVGCWFANDGEGKLWKVEWRTGSVGAVDEVINEDGKVDEERRERRTGSLEAIISAR